MTAVDARIRVHHPCPYCDISVEFPRTRLQLWCDNRRDVFLLSAPDPAELRRVVAALRESLHARTLVTDGLDALVQVPDFEWADPPSVTGLARRTGVWVLHPVVYFEGKETYRFLAPTKRSLNGLVARLRRLGDVEILSVSEREGLGAIRELPMTSVHLWEGLTERQSRSMIAAFEAGLFDVPSRTSWAAVARREGLSRSTFGEHLRKGQLRLLSNSYESLRSRALGKEAPIVLSSTAPDRTRRAPLRGTRTAGAGEAWAAAKPRDPDPAMRRPPINPRRSAPTRRR